MPPPSLADPLPPLLDQVASLVDKSLLRPPGVAAGEQRFMMLETLREYALAQLEASGEGETVRQRHAAFYLAVAELAEPHLQGPNQASWLDQLEAEHDNFRAALGWALRPGSSRDATELAVRLAAALAEFWWPRGHCVKGSTFSRRP